MSSPPADQRAHPPSTRRVVLVVVLAVAVVSAVIVTATQLSSGGGASSALAARLLSVSELPAGWRLDTAPSPSQGLNANHCLSKLTGGNAASTHSSVAFLQGSGLPFVADAVGTTASPARQFRSVTRTLDGCHSLTFISGSLTLHATLVPLALAPVGAASAAFTLAFAVGGIPITVDLVIYRIHGLLGYLEYGDSVAPPLSAVQAFADAAAARAGGASPSIPAVSIASAPVRVAHTRDGAVAYREFGSGPPLVLITGYVGTMEDWDPRFVDALAQHHRVVTFDNAGIGATSALPTPLTVDAMANQTSALIDSLGLGHPDVLGWSMGGLIAQALAVLHPDQVRRLVLCATFPGGGDVIRPAQSAINALTNGDAKAAIADLFPADQTGAYDAFAAAIADYPGVAPASPAVAAAQRHAVLAWWNDVDPAGGRTSTISAPTLVADGTLDRLDAVANDHALARLIPGSRLVLYPGAGHAFLFQDAPTFVARVESFLA